MSSFPDRAGTFAPALALAALALCLATAPRPALAAHGFDACTGEIAALPATLATPGTWCLKQNLSTAINSGGAINVDTDNVTVACNGFALRSTAGSPSLASGVLSGDHANVTVRDCTIDGFNVGVYLYGQRATSRGHRVERNRIDHSTTAGIIVHGDGSVVRDNQMHETGGVDSGIYALQVFFNVDVIGNTVERVTSLQGDAVGIFMGGADSTASAIGNRVRGLSSGPNGGRIGISAQNSGTGGSTIRKNDIANAGASIVTDKGIYCFLNIHGARGNQVNGLPTGVLGCRNDGDNVLVP
jgi:hypothetical protein